MFQCHDTWLLIISRSPELLAQSLHEEVDVVNLIGVPIPASSANIKVLSKNRYYPWIFVTIWFYIFVFMLHFWSQKWRGFSNSCLASSLMLMLQPPSWRLQGRVYDLHVSMDNDGLYHAASPSNMINVTFMCMHSRQNKSGNFLLQLLHCPQNSNPHM
jgi:hypothetical protein